MRLSVLIAALAVAAPIGLCAGSASAQFFEDQSILFGRRHGSVYEGPGAPARTSAAAPSRRIARFNSFEACRRLVIQGNRGFCTQNPAFTGYRERPLRKKKRSVSR